MISYDPIFVDGYVVKPNPLISRAHHVGRFPETTVEFCLHVLLCTVLQTALPTVRRMARLICELLSSYDELLGKCCDATRPE